MRIIIDNKTSINVTSEYYAVCSWGLIRKGKEGWREESWFTSLEGAVRKIVQKNLGDKDIQVSLEEYVDMCKKASENLNEAISLSGQVE